MESDFKAVETLLGYAFLSRSILLQAMTHSSYANELANNASPVLLENNERLEFLGDAVIGLIVARALMERFPDASEGRLSRWRSSLVSRKTLAAIAADLGVGDHLLLGRGELRTGGNEKRSILAAALEALVGALYVDGGIDVAGEFLMTIYEPWFSSLHEGDETMFKLMDKKTHLQERTQSIFRCTPIYQIVDSWGPEHEKIFRVEIIINEKVVAQGDGRSKKDAEQQAAGLALEILKL
ncbi:MAG: ribonuclease III [Bdellovibrionales bacterium]|nr:ribonuclease III [Bdellovibrionales bacterium]